jgi:hypothetical protein
LQLCHTRKVVVLSGKRSFSKAVSISHSTFVLFLN